MKKQKIDYLQWRNRLAEFTTPNMRIGTDIMLIKEGFGNPKDKPFRTDVTTCIIYIKGGAHFRINMKEFQAKAPCLVIIPCNAITETISTDDESMTRIIVMSREFTDQLFSVQHNVAHLLNDITSNPVIDLSGEESALISYYSMVKNLISRANTPYRLEAIKHLTLALFYSYTSTKHTTTQATKRERKDEIADQFFELLRQNYKQQRELSFYADNMFLTSKYLSSAVKEATGRSASDWIDEYVATESKALLYSTDQTIQQIAAELHFESQSLFGKFFKRVTGLSPRAYRNSIASVETDN